MPKKFYNISPKLSVQCFCVFTFLCVFLINYNVPFMIYLLKFCSYKILSCFSVVLQSSMFQLKRAVPFRLNFWRLSYLSDTDLSSKKMFPLLPNKIFVFTTTFKLFGVKTRVAEMWQASKIWPKMCLFCSKGLLNLEPFKVGKHQTESFFSLFLFI